jgi:predicted membrane protein
MRFIKCHPLITVTLTTVVGVIVGVIIGEHYAARTVQSITQGADPNDLKFDNVWIVVLGIRLTWLVGSTIAGLILGIIACVVSRQKRRVDIYP